MVTSSYKTYKYEEIDGFLRLPSRKGHHSSETYRDILPSKAENSDSDSSVSESESNSDAESDSPTLTAHQVTLKSLEQQLNADPHQEEVWLRLISQTLSTVPPSSKNANQVRAEISVSILVRALVALPKSSALRLRYVRSGEQIWHESKLRSEWTTAFAVGGTELRMEWLEWRIRKAVNGLESVIEDARRVLNTYGDTEDDELVKLRIIWRMGVAFANAGIYLTILLSWCRT